MRIHMSLMERSMSKVQFSKGAAFKFPQQFHSRHKQSIGLKEKKIKSLRKITTSKNHSLTKSIEIHNYHKNWKLLKKRKRSLKNKSTILKIKSRHKNKNRKKLNSNMRSKNKEKTMRSSVYTKKWAVWRKKYKTNKNPGKKKLKKAK